LQCKVLGGVLERRTAKFNHWFRLDTSRHKLITVSFHPQSDHDMLHNVYTNDYIMTSNLDFGENILTCTTSSVENLGLLCASFSSVLTLRNHALC
jgi:hypothetical protein